MQSKVINSETGKNQVAIILLAGDIMSYKRVVQFSSSPYYIKDKDKY